MARKQVYSITRTQFFKNLVKHPTWQVKHIDYDFQGVAYVYGCEATKGDQTITVQPHFNDGGERLFTVTYRAKPSDVATIHKHVNIRFVKTFVNSIVYGK